MSQLDGLISPASPYRSAGVTFIMLGSYYYFMLLFILALMIMLYDVVYGLTDFFVQYCTPVLTKLALVILLFGFSLTPN